MGSSAISGPPLQLPLEIKEFIRGEQENGYRNLAIKLGLGTDPQKGYERLSGSLPSSGLHSPYENPNGYGIMARLLTNIQKALAVAGAPWQGPEPALATLPSG